MDFSLIALFLNFFLSLNKVLNTFLFFFPFLLKLFFLNKSFFKKIIYYSFPIAILFFLTISYDGTYRPDAGSYHLPFISILNENKILIGINNIHFRFGHTSIIQYLSAIYNNYIFTEKGILIPSGLIYCNFVGYCIYEIFQNKNRNFHKILIFILLIFVIFRVNRYSDFGNDAPANLIFFYLIIESTRDSEIFLKIKKTIFASTFIFLNKITLLFAFLIPIYFIFKNFRIKRLVNKISITCLLFIILYTGKNILISGCIMFPVEQTCISKLFWYDKNSNRASNAVNARLENEAWTKGWMDQSGNKKNYEQFLINFNWTKTWVSSEGKKIIKKTFPFFVFLLILYILLLYSEKLIIQKDEKKIKLPNEYYLCAIVCIFGSILWFLKFPVFRYGYGYLISLI